MTGFIYNGQSTNDILSVPLILCSFDSENVDFVATERETVGSDVSIYNDVINEYGVKHKTKEFVYALVKENGDLFTYDEQVIIERWLTSTIFSKDVYIFDCKTMETQLIYNGKFIKTSWKATSFGGYVGCEFTFENNGAYAKKYCNESYQVRGNETVVLDCLSDNDESYIYPVIHITNPINNENVSIVNHTDDSKTMTVATQQNLQINIDCDKCIISDQTTNGVISFVDLGWNDVQSIYWLRLKPGENTLQIIGNVDLEIDYVAVSKRAGDWIL